MMLGLKPQEHNLGAGAAGMEDGKVKAEVDRDMERSPSKTERAGVRNQDIAEDKKKKNLAICSKNICVCV